YACAGHPLRAGGGSNSPRLTYSVLAGKAIRRTTKSFLVFPSARSGTERGRTNEGVPRFSYRKILDRICPRGEKQDGKKGKSCRPKFRSEAQNSRPDVVIGPWSFVIWEVTLVCFAPGEPRSAGRHP